MGTNYYRVPSAEDMEQRHAKLKERVDEMSKMDHLGFVESGYSYIHQGEWDRLSPWDEFIQGTSIHLGKRSGGWKFCWNFHKDKYYKDKETLFAFIGSGRIVDEYGTEFTPDEFIEMAMTWCPDGWDTQTYYKEHPGDRISWMDYSQHADTYVDGLRISSSINFS